VLPRVSRQRRIQTPQPGFFEEVTAVNQWKSWIQKLGHPEKARAERRIPSGLIAWQTNTPAPHPSIIRNISSTGLYLLTEERWPVDELVPLTIEMKDLPENRAEDRIPIQARVARHGEDGIGLAFVLPAGLDRDLWEVLVRNAVVLTDPKDLSHTLRLIRTALFLYRLCHEEAHAALQLIGSELVEPRPTIAMQIAFATEKLLASEPDADKMRAHSQIVADILKYGSSAEDDLTRQLWINLFVGSCQVNNIDESNRPFVDLLVSVRPIQGLILLAAFKKATERRPKPGDVSLAPGDSSSPRIIYSKQEMIRLTGINNPVRLGGEVSSLFSTGLIEEPFVFTLYVTTESLDLTPTRLALDLYERCKADRIQPNSPPEESQST
jgi:hypothetical protein